MNPPIRLFRIDLTCDHDVIVAAYTPEGALEVAELHAGDHFNSPDVLLDTLREISLAEPTLLAVVDGLS